MDCPFREPDTSGDVDESLVTRAQLGDREALEELVVRHQKWIYNLALRMVCDPDDAQDVTQEALVKVITRLSTFRARSRFRTWLYRIVANHVVSMKRREKEWPELSFETYARCLDGTPDLDLTDSAVVSAELSLAIEEAKILCTTGMLLCLDRRERLTYILGAIFGTSDRVGAEIMGITRANFRQVLTRARRELHSFMDGQCGLVNDANSCRCHRKTRAFIQRGSVDPQDLNFAQSHVQRVRDAIGVTGQALEDVVEEKASMVFREHRLPDPPDQASLFRKLLADPRVSTILRL